MPEYLILNNCSYSIDINATSPKSERVNAVTIWILYCILNVFLALSEYGLILFIKFQRGRSLSKSTCLNHQSQKIKLDVRPKGSKSGYVDNLSRNELKNNGTDNGLDRSVIQTSNDATNRCGQCVDLTKIDIVSMVVFPTSFLVFNVVYWSMFM